MNKININNSSIYVSQDHSHDLVYFNNNRTLSNKIKDVASASLNGIKAILIKNYRRIAAYNTPFPTPVLNAQNTYQYPKEDLPWNDAKESNGVYFFMHGLFGFPADWNVYMDKMEDKNPGVHVFAPYVPLHGNCHHETAGKPLLEALENYLEKFPGKPVTLIGTSNGGRLASYLESHLDPKILGSSSLTTVSIAGVHYGSKLIDLLNKMSFLPFSFLDKDLKEEFSYGSETAQHLLNTWQMKQSIWKEHGVNVRHLFCATTEDEKIQETASSLPYHKDAQTTYKVISGHSHTSIVDEMCDDIFQWLDE